METTKNARISITARLERFLVREDAVYNRYERGYQAQTKLAKVVYLFLYLLPGICSRTCGWLTE